MRLANLAGRAVLLVEGGAVDIERLTGGKFGPSARSVLDNWEAFRAAVSGLSLAEAEVTVYDVGRLGAPVPEPRQIFAIGLNYRGHAEESGVEPPTHPLVFTKFPNSLCGPTTTIELPTAGVDYEAELVVTIAKDGYKVPAGEALEYVAGLSVGQDLSEREVQHRGPMQQFSLGKSFPGFSPVGPALVTFDELESTDLAIRCSIGEEVLQEDRTGDLIFDVPTLVEYISHICPISAGDLIFTGTPGGVGMGHTPPRWLRPGETLLTEIEGLGKLENPLTQGY